MHVYMYYSNFAQVSHVYSPVNMYTSLCPHLCCTGFLIRYPVFRCIYEHTQIYDLHIPADGFPEFQHFVFPAQKACAIPRR